LIHGGRDQLVRDEHMSLLMRSLQSSHDNDTHAGGRSPHKAILLPYAQHGFDYNFNGWGAQVTQPVLLDFLDTHLREVPSGSR
jgi:hypothetical protein